MRVSSTVQTLLISSTLFGSALSFTATNTAPSALSFTTAKGISKQHEPLAMSADSESSSTNPTRHQFLQTLTTSALLTTMTLTTSSLPASAAKYGGFGADSPNVLDPKTATIDRDILASESCQKAIASITQYSKAVKFLQDKLKENDQTDIGPFLRKEFDFTKLRSDLNAVNEAFDEDTQRGTDRLVRLVLQDITELEAANRQKEGVPRSEKRLGIMQGKLSKLDRAFSDFLAFVA